MVAVPPTLAKGKRLLHSDHLTVLLGEVFDVRVAQQLFNRLRIVQ
jgi:hypothetical protein